MKIYKIRNQKGLYSTGGQIPKWSKCGKSWTSKGALSSHLSLVINSCYDNCDLIELETIENAVIPIKEILEEKKLSKIEKERKMQEYIVKCKEQRERQQLKELKIKYE
jgi:hypothetical protein